jgi:RNA-directed DNA polymerase
VEARPEEPDQRLEASLARGRVRGHYAYYGITGNKRMLQEYLCAVHRAWRKWLDHRNRQREMNWDTFNRLLSRYGLPPPRIVHSYVKRAKP